MPVEYVAHEVAEEEEGEVNVMQYPRYDQGWHGYGIIGRSEDSYREV